MQEPNDLCGLLKQLVYQIGLDGLSKANKPNQTLQIVCHHSPKTKINKLQLFKLDIEIKT